MKLRSAVRAMAVSAAAVLCAGGAPAQTPPAQPKPSTPAQPAAPGAQPAPAQPGATPATIVPAKPAETGDKPPLKQEELEQVLAPIALYPDSLLAQIFMASTYPLEIVEADRWVKANPTLKGDAQAAELEKKPWDASVKSLVNFPDILSMMSEKLTMTRQLGDAFLGQQKEVMETVQKLRAKAQAQGNLKTNKEQVVKTAPSDAGTQVIVIESSSPEVVYVPSYNPTVVYGSWPYPAYPPYPYYPPGYVASSVVSFGVGVACGACWAYAFGNCNWGGNDVDIDVNRNTNINNKNIDRSKYGKGSGNLQNGKGSWKHDSAHRQGVGYRNQATSQRVGAGSSNAAATQARDSYRGAPMRAGRTSLAAGQIRARGGGAADRSGGGAGAGNRGGGGSGGVSVPSNRASQSGGGSAFSGVDRGGSDARSSSSRGQSSRSASPSSSGSRSSSGGGRSSGGGGRSGGGGGRGGGGRR